VIVSFGDAATEDLFNGVDSRRTRHFLPRELWAKARLKLDMLHEVDRLESLRFPPGNRLEALKGDRKGQHSIRINAQYRICFTWTPSGPADVEVVDYH